MSVTYYNFNLLREKTMETLGKPMFSCTKHTKDYFYTANKSNEKKYGFGLGTCSKLHGFEGGGGRGGGGGEVFVTLFFFFSNPND